MARKVQQAGVKSYDLVIIGGGAGGLVGARLAAWLGAKVLLVERERLGGDCLHTGCVPSKALIRSAQVAHLLRQAASFGLTPHEPTADLARVAESVQGVVRAVGEQDAPEALRALGIDLLFGEARFRSPQVVAVDGAAIQGRRFLIATGSRPLLPPLAGLADSSYRTTDDIFALRELPRSLVVVGGGPVAVELGQAFARLGSRVVIVEMMDHLLPGEDAEAAALVAAVLREEGVEVQTGRRVTALMDADGQRVVRAERAGRTVECVAEEVLLALGRAPNVETLGLEEAGVAWDAKGIAVNDRMQTSAKHIYACGDVAGGPFFTHVAAYQAAVAVRNALLPGRMKVDYRVLPRAVFTDPEVAQVGFTEAEARQRYGNVRVTRLSLAEVDRAQTERSTRGFIKVVTRPGGAILGATVVAPHAGDLIQEYALAMSTGLRLDRLSQMVHAYPTFSTGNQLAAYRFMLERWSFGRAGRLLRRLATRLGLWLGG